MHLKATQDCDSGVRAVLEVLERASGQGFLFPRRLQITRNMAAASVGRENGGWADPRDQQLCLDIANGTTTVT